MCIAGYFLKFSHKFKNIYVNPQKHSHVKILKYHDNIIISTNVATLSSTPAKEPRFIVEPSRCCRTGISGQCKLGDILSASKLDWNYAELSCAGHGGIFPKVSVYI